MGVERQLAAMCKRIAAWHAHRRLRALFAAWASLTQQEHLGRLADMVGCCIVKSDPRHSIIGRPVICSASGTVAALLECCANCTVTT